MLRATLKSLLSRKLRLILSGLAVVLGVMFVAGSLVLTDTLGRSFDQLFTNGFQLQFVTEIVTGIVATLLLALVADLLLQLIGRLVTPWTRVGR